MKPDGRITEMLDYLSRVPTGTAYIPFQTLKLFFHCKSEDVAFKTVEFSQQQGLRCEKLDEHTWKFNRAC